MNTQKGFTLIELMIVVAIIGILSAIAIPAYQDFTKKAKLSEPMNVAGAAKTKLEVEFQTTGSFPGDTSAGTEPIPEIGDAEHISALEWTQADQKLKATVANIDSTEDGSALTFTADTSGNGVTWSCTYGGTSSLKPDGCN